MLLEKVKERLLHVFENDTEPSNFLSEFFTLDKKFKTNRDANLLFKIKDRDLKRIAIPVGKDGRESRKNSVAGLESEKSLDYFMFSEKYEIERTQIERHCPCFLDNGADRFRLLELMMLENARITNSIIRTSNLMAAQILQDGKISIVETKNNQAYSLDFARDAKNTITAAKTWTDVTADIIGNIEAAANIVRANGRIPDTIILGSEAYAGLAKNTQILGLLDNRSFNVGTLGVPSTSAIKDADVTLVSNGLNIGGNVFKVYLYNGKYTDNNNVEHNFIDPKNAIVLSSSAEKVLSYSRPYIIKPQDDLGTGITGISSAKRRIATSFSNWIPSDAKTMQAMIETRMLLLDAEINTTVCIKAVL